MSVSSNGVDYEFGEYVKDIVSEREPGAEAGIMVIVDVHRDESPDEFVVDAESGETLHDVVDDWPHGSDEDYEPGDDFVVDTVYMEALDRKFGGEWLKWDKEKLIRLCERNDVRVYSYHASRLSETSPMTFPK